MVEERQHEQNDRVLSSRADFGDRDRSHILGMGATEPPGVYRTSIQSRRGSRTQVTGAASERNLEQAAVIPSSPSLAREPVDRQEVTVSSSPPVPASERNLEQAAAIPSSPSLAQEPVDRQEVTVSSSPPALASERNLETGGRDTELTFARTGTSRSARGDGFIKPTGAGERTQFGTGGRDTELTFARTGTSRSARGDGFIKPTGAGERTQFGNRRP